MSGPVFIALTAAGVETARRAQAATGGEVHAPAALGSDAVDREFTDFAAHLRTLFEDDRPVVGLCAAGILIRLLAPLFTDKRDEPPVLALSEDGASVVPLVGGHHGANDLARALADALGGHAAITTAGDSRFGVALDAPPPGWTLANPEEAKPVMAALLNGAAARLEGDAPWLAASRIPFSDDGAVHLVATPQAMGVRDSSNAETPTSPLRGGAETAAPHGDLTLVYHPRKLAVGMGCERGADPEEAMVLLQRTLAEANLSPDAVALIASLDLKADEPAILNAAERLGVPARFFSAAALEKEAPRLANPSEAVFREVGCHGVAEGAALAAAGPAGRLVVAKQKSQRVTCAITEAPTIIDALQVGRARGRLAIVGIGPGAANWLTPEAKHLLETSDAAIGYALYLDLVAARFAHAERFDSPLGAEEARVRQALALAAEGRAVALVSSGDPGIYAMATLAFECLERAGIPDAARRVEIVVAPGVSAMQAAAARAGAPLGHDFCAISLSDLLTPWGTIEARIRAAAEGDFVISFYNPVSQRRRTQLARARDILLHHRSPETPVILARNLGRAEESVTTLPLHALSADDVDMLTLVIVGASTTRQVDAAGQTWTYTPRGYETKRHVDAAE